MACEKIGSFAHVCSWELISYADVAREPVNKSLVDVESKPPQIAYNAKTRRSRRPSTYPENSGLIIR